MSTDEEVPPQDESANDLVEIGLVEVYEVDAVAVDEQLDELDKAADALDGDDECQAQALALEAAVKLLWIIAPDRRRARLVLGRLHTRFAAEGQALRKDPHLWGVLTVVAAIMETMSRYQIDNTKACDTVKPILDRHKIPAGNLITLRNKFGARQPHRRFVESFNKLADSLCERVQVLAQEGVTKTGIRRGLGGELEAYLRRRPYRPREPD